MKKFFCLLLPLVFTLLLAVACSNSTFQFKIIFQSDNKTYATVSVNSDGSVTMPEQPAKEGYIFEGWFFDNDVWLQPLTISSLLNTPVKNNITVYAKWKKQDSPLTVKLKQIYNLSVEAEIFSGTYEEWIETVRGPKGLPGEDGREITLRVENGYIQWQYIGETNWQNLIEISALKGSSGNDGANGLSAYEIYKLHNPDYSGTEEQWLQELFDIKNKQMLNFYPLNNGLEYGVEVGNAIFLSQIIIPQTYMHLPVTTILSYGFAHCNNLTSIIIPESIVEIHSEAFYGSENVTIFCYSSSQPLTWDFSWNIENRPVVWDYSDKESTYSFDTNYTQTVAPITANILHLAPHIEREGFVIEGWYDNPQFEGEKIAFPYYNKNDITLYAKWLLEEFTQLEILWNDKKSLFFDVWDFIDESYVLITDNYHGLGNYVIRILNIVLAIECEPEDAQQMIDYLNSTTEELGLEYSILENTNIVIMDWFAIRDIFNDNLLLINNVYFSSDQTTLIRYKGQDTHYTIPDNVTEIGYYAFLECSFLTSISIPNSVLTIGVCAFSGCNGLTTIIIPQSVIIIEKYAFSFSHNLKSVIFEDDSSLEIIGEYAFYGCISLPAIIIPNSVTSIGESGFNSCANLESIILSENLQSIDAATFANCIKLKTIIIPDSVTIIDVNAFLHCYNLKNIIFGENSSLAIIEENAFYGCSSLESIIIPGGVIYIGPNVFNDCIKLQSITLNGEPPFIGYNYMFNILSALKIYVQGQYYNDYLNADSWSNYINKIHAENIIVFNGNGATSGTMPDQKIKEGDFALLNYNTYQREDFRFVGWAISSDGEVMFQNGAFYFMGNSPVNNLYAVWERVSGFFSITYNVNEGTMPSDYIQGYTYNVLTILPIPTKEGYDFGGWYESADFSSEKLGSLHPGTIGDKTLYALWLAPMNDINTVRMEAENTNLLGRSGPGFSGSQSDEKRIEAFEDASGGKVVGWTLGPGIFIDYEFTLDRTITTTLTIGLGSIIGNVTFNPTNLRIYVNGQIINWGSLYVEHEKFTSVSINDFTLLAGKNTVVFEVLENNLHPGFDAVGPLYDYIEVSAKADIGWNPVFWDPVY